MAIIQGGGDGDSNYHDSRGNGWKLTNLGFILKVEWIEIVNGYGLWEGKKWVEVEDTVSDLSNWRIDLLLNDSME